MVRLVDLDDGEGSTRSPNDVKPYLYIRNASSSDEGEDNRPNPNINSFSAALGCYPIVSQIARHLDLNSLDDLSVTCRQFHVNLIQYRPQLIRQTLRCSNEDTDVGPRLAVRLLESRDAWMGTNGRQWESKITSGRVGQCARDMVGECRRCGVVVCRNCTIKPPSNKLLSGRYRRLCRTCIKTPLRWHILPEEADDSGFHPNFTNEAFSRAPCSCPDSVYLCYSCGNAMKSADITYMRGWTWRTRYSTYLGGLGTGIGEGNEGVECGKGSHCLGAREIEKEIDCDAEELADLRREIEKVEKEGRQWGGTSYLTQEIEGIGGIVKKKVKRRVKVGKVVKEYEDERENGDYLGREQKGLNRSWCSWCARIVPGIKDKTPALDLSLQLSNSSSSSIRSQGLADE